jgi:hypothetical protein
MKNAKTELTIFQSVSISATYLKKYIKKESNLALTSC